MKPTRRIGRALLAATLAFAASTGAAFAQAKKPNILVIWGDDIGIIVSGELANFTVLSENPVTCEAGRIQDIAVVGTVHEGRIFSAAADKTKANTHYRVPENFKPVANVPVLNDHAHSHDEGLCSCSSGKVLASVMFSKEQD